jgi:hypothetical protein
MMRKLLLLFAFLGLTFGAAFAQTGKLAGKVLDKTTREPIAFGAVVLKLNGAQKAHGTTDINGAYSISGLTPGAYSVEMSYVGYKRVLITGVVVTVDKTTALNLEIEPAVTEIDPGVVVTAYREPIIGPEKVGQTITSEQIKKIATVDVGSLASTAAGAQSADDGRGISLRGSRTSGTVYYVNGVKQLVTPTLSPNSIAQMTVVSGGQPAQYGDAAGGVVNITTSSPSANFQGGFSGESSSLFDKYNNNRYDFSLTGPILTKKDAADPSNNKSILGFFLSGQYQSSSDDSPSAQGVYSLKDATRSRINEKPLIKDPSVGYSAAAQQVTLSDFEKSKIRENVASQRYNVNTSFDFQPVDNIMFTFGGLYNRSDRNLYYNPYSLFNSENNPQQIINNWNVYGRLQHFFREKPGDSTSSAIKNAFYQIQADYSKYDRVIQNERLKDDIWRYGYIGKFNQEQEPFYANGNIRLRNNPNDPNDTTTAIFNIPIDRGDIGTSLTFDPSGDNGNLASYSNQIIADRADIGQPVTNIFDLMMNQGILNGGSPSTVYSIYTNSGSVYPLYQLLNNDQFRLTALGSAELGKHTFRLGFEFEQRVETNYAVNGNSLWNYARAYTIGDTQLDNSNMIVTRDASGKPTRVDFGTKAVANQSTFAKNLRNKLGLQPNAPINIDAISPDDLSVNMFSPDELSLTDVVNYQGYTYDGKRTTKKVAFEDYFSDIANRPQDAFRPNYSAVWLEDKFQIEDLTLRAGVRVDRYDANQKVLKDPYALVDLLKAKDVRSLKFANNYSIPSNIGDDYVIYLNRPSEDFTMSTSANYQVTGYRKDNVFYDVNGVPTDNTNEIVQNGIYPLFDESLQGAVGKEYLRDRGLSVKAFKDYEPQIYVMPRLSFSFPISEDALFFAHYDILTQRPERNGTLPSDYYYMRGSISPTINNPDLKLQKTIDYEVGFEQRLTKSSGLTISAYYKEFRDQISYRRITAAYPQEYFTFGNLDFGTVKGMTMEYDLRRTGNLAMTASYTLQFAKGTGSSATSGFNLVSQGSPNLRTPMPLDFDQRHAFKVNLDYRFRDKEGPLVFDKAIFENTGLNVTVNAGSGTPYSRQANITNYINAIGRPVLEGTMNGSRLPGNYRVGLRLDKDFKIGKTVSSLVNGEKVEKFEENKFVKALNVYFRVENLFNTMNVLNVYRFTGSAEDDGYLDTYREKFGSEANQSLMDIYYLRVLSGGGSDGVGSNPTNYSLPRRAYLGLSLSF